MFLRIRFLLPILLALPLSLLAAHGAEQAPNSSDRRVTEALELWKGGDTSARLRALRRLERLGARASPAVPALITGLTDPDPAIRREIAEVLGRIGPTANQAVPALTTALKDPERDVRAAAARALGTTKPDPKLVIPALVASIRTEAGHRCSEPIYTLQALGEPSVPVLIDLLNDNDPKLRQWVISALGGIGPPAKAAVPVLINSMREPDCKARAWIAESLAKVGPEAVEPLARALRDRDPRVRGGAARALELMGPRATAAVPVLIAALADHETLAELEPARGSSYVDRDREEEPRPSGYDAALRAIGAPAVPALLERLDSPDRNARVLALSAIGFIGGEAKSAVPRLLSLLNDPHIRLEAASALGGIGPAARAAIPPLLAGLKDPDPAFRARAAETIGRIGWQRQAAQFSTRTVARRSIAPLAAALKDTDPRVRAAAATALRDIGSEAAIRIPDLVLLLCDPVADVRRAALGALPRLDAAATPGPETIGRLLADVDRRVRLAAAKVVGDDDLDAEGVITGLLAALKDPDPDVRAEAAYKLARTNGKGGISVHERSLIHGYGKSTTLAKSSIAGGVLRTALTDPELRVRAGAAYAIPVFKREAGSSVPLLVARLKDSSVLVRIAAAVALGQFGSDARAAVPDLLDALADPGGIGINDFSVASKAAQALGGISPEAANRMTDHIFTLLDSPKEDVRHGAGKALANRGVMVSPRLFQALANPKTSRRAQIEILNVLADDRGAGDVASSGEPAPLPPEAREAIPALRALTRDSDDTVRENARNVVSSLERGDEPRTRTLLEAAREEDLARWAFDQAIEDLDTSAVGMLIEGLKDPDDEVRTVAAYGLAALTDKLPAADDGGPDGDKLDPAEETARAEGLQLRTQAVAALIPALKDPDTQARWAAAWGLRRLGPGSKEKKEVVAALCAMLRDRTSRVRSGAMIYFAISLNDRGGSSRCGGEGNGQKLRIAAIQALAGFDADAATAVPDLIDALRDDDRLTRWYAAGALEPIGPAARAAVPALIEVLRSKDKVPADSDCVGFCPTPGDADDRGVRLAVAAARALKGIGPDARPAVPALIEVLNDPDESLRSEGAVALGSIGPNAGAAVPALVRAIKDCPVETLADQAALALGQIGSEAVRALIEALHDHDGDVRRHAATALGGVGTKAAAAIPDLLPTLSDSDEEIRTAAAEALGQIGIGPGAAAAVPGLLGAIKDSDRDVRRIAALALGKIGPSSDRVIPALIFAMRDADNGVKHAGSSALEMIGMPALPALRALLRDDDRKLQDAAALALRRIADPQATGPEGETGEQARVRAKAARSLLFAALNDPDERTRAGASRALGYIGKDVVPELVVALGDMSSLVRLQAVRALGIIGNEASAALGSVRERLGDRDPNVRAAAEATIKAILTSDP